MSARNALLAEMTDAVAEEVLYSSYTQTQALSVAERQARSMAGVHARLIRQLEQAGRLRRELEYLPTEKAIATRRPERRGLVAPELAVLMAYVKIALFECLLASDVPEDPYLRHDLERYFPAPLPERYRRADGGHRLRREIIATVIANQLVDRGGTTFVFRLGEETGAAPAQLARAFAVAREVFAMRSFWGAVEALDDQVSASVQLEMLIEGRRLVERATRWLVRGHPEAHRHRRPRRAGSPGRPSCWPRRSRRASGGSRSRGLRPAPSRARRAPAFRPELARRVASMQSLLSVFDIVEEDAATGQPQPVVAATYFGLGRCSGWTGCATGSSSCPAPTAGRRWPARRYGTTSIACIAR